MRFIQLKAIRFKVQPLIRKFMNDQPSQGQSTSSLFSWKSLLLDPLALGGARARENAARRTDRPH